MCDAYGEICFSEKKCFTNELNMNLLRWAWIEKTVHSVWKHTDFLSEETALDTMVSKEGLADNLQRYERTHHNRFP